MCDVNYDSDSSDLSIKTLVDYDLDLSSQENIPRLEAFEEKCEKKQQREVYKIKKYNELADILQLNPSTPSVQSQNLLTHCEKYFQFKLSENQRNYLMKKIDNFVAHYNQKWKRSNRTKIRFDKKEKTWLQNYLTVPENWFDFPGQSTSKIKNCKSTAINKFDCTGPIKLHGQRKEFVKLGKRSQEKVVQRVTQNLQSLPTPVILRSASQIMSRRRQKSTSQILKEIEKSPTRSQKMLSKYKQSEMNLRPLTANEGLAAIIQLKLSVSSYKFLRKETKDRGCDFFPSYHKITKAKYLCHPANITVTEMCAQVPLQQLLHHSASRIVESQHDVIWKHASTNASQIYTLIEIYGFDGSSGHSQYNQKFEITTGTDTSLFATTFTPMRFVTSNDFILWQNPAPQSIRYCRPLKMEFTKETTDKLQLERDNIAEAINELIPVTTFVENIEVLVKFDLRLTAIDGKALQAVTQVTKSTQACPLCGSNPSEFNNLCNLQNKKFEAKQDVLVHGVSPLHCWLRFFEFCLKLAYRKPAKLYPVTTPDAKLKYNETKKLIQDQLRNSLGLLVDIVRPGSGTTNTGNVARKAFENHETFAKILNIDKEFVRALHIILITVSSQFAIKAHEFGEFCLETMKRYVSRYHWHPLSATLHRVLVHVEAIIENSILPLGLMGEDAAESRNRFYRHDREFHARQMSRIANLEDIFHRALESSDPVISSYFLASRKNHRHRLRLPPEVLCFLEDPVDPSKILHNDTVILVDESEITCDNNDNPFDLELENLELENEDDDE